MSDLSQEDAKLLTMARSARARIGATEGAAVRDGDGRTYTGATVALPSFEISALRLAVASAVAAGASKLEAALVVSEASTVDRAAAEDLTAGVLFYLADPSGAVTVLS